MPTTSIIIPTYNQCEELLKPCLASIIANTDLTDTEVIVSANGCSDGTREFVTSLGPAFRLVWHNDALGFAGAVNKGIVAAHGKYIVLLNNDVVILDFQPVHTWIKRLIDPLADPHVGVTGIATYHHATGMKFMPFYCVGIAMETFEMLGLLDEIFDPGYGEDLDFCLRAVKAGYQLLQVSNNFDHYNKTHVTNDFPVYHSCEGTFGTIPQIRVNAINRQTKIVAKRWGWV